MKGVAGLTLLLANVRLSRPCYREETILICSEIPSYFEPGYSTLVMVLTDVGEINSTVLHSDNLASITRLSINNAGVTGIAEAAFSSFSNLRSVSLDRNVLSEMNPDWFGEPAVLSELSLAENQIEVVNESELHGLTNLTQLRLNKNKIRSVHPNSFSSQTVLANLDLSENRMTRLSPLVFRSLVSTRIRLDGNPWDCSCGAEDFVFSLKDLQSRSLLDREMDVTCVSPPSLSGQPVWNVSACATSPPPEPSSPTQTVHPNPSDALTPVPATTAKVMTTSSTSETETPARHRPTEAPVMMSSLSGTRATSSPSGADASTDVPIASSHPAGGTETLSLPSQPPLDTNIVCTLAVVIAVLFVLLLAMCLLAALRRWKRNNKSVTPGRPTDDDKKLEEDGRLSRDGDPEMARRRSFTGVRAKSANAVILTSPFCASVKHQVTSETETGTQSEVTGNPAEGQEKLVNESEAAAGIQTESLSDPADVIGECEKRGNVGRNLDESLHCVSDNTDTVPYLSIGTNQNNPSPDDESAPGHRSQRGKVIGRISTWPPTAVQWQARCKMKGEGEEEEGGGFIVWAQNVAEKFSEEVKTGNKMEHPSSSDGGKKEDETEDNQREAQLDLRHFESFKPNDKTRSFSEAHPHTDSRPEEQLRKERTTQDPAAVRQTTDESPNLNQGKPSQNPDLKPAESPAGRSRKSSRKADVRKEPQRAVLSRQRAEHGAAGSKAPSGGTSPDDETLLSGNEYAFMNLLHEVVQNNGRWTRERWKEMHVNKQRRPNRGTEDV